MRRDIIDMIQYGMIWTSFGLVLFVMLEAFK
jgi:hypothetical protein